MDKISYTRGLIVDDFNDPLPVGILYAFNEKPIETDGHAPRRGRAPH